MIRIVYERVGDDHRLTIGGHAEFAPHGADIVCAAVSAIFQTALLGFAEIARNYAQHVSYTEK